MTVNNERANIKNGEIINTSQVPRFMINSNKQITDKINDNTKNNIMWYK